MTTIAWDGKTLAADRQATTAYGVTKTVHKIHDCGAYIYAGAGQYLDTLEVADWLRDGANKDKRPEFSEPCGGIAIHKATGIAYEVDGKFPVFTPILDQFIGLGSGREAALAVLHMGGTPRRAVEISMRISCYSGLGIDVVRCPKRKSKQ